MNTLLKPPRTSTKYTLCAWRHWLIPKCLVRLACRPSTRRCTLCHWPLSRYLGRGARTCCLFRRCMSCGYGLGSCWFFASLYRLGCRSLRLSLRARMRSRSIKPRTIASSISFVINDFIFMDLPRARAAASCSIASCISFMGLLCMAALSLPGY